MSSLAGFQEFEAGARTRGFDEVLVRDWQPNPFLKAHSHPLQASAVVAKGEMWLTVGDDARHFLGDTFELAPGLPHSAHRTPNAERRALWAVRRHRLGRAAQRLIRP